MRNSVCHSNHFPFPLSSSALLIPCCFRLRLYPFAISQFAIFISVAGFGVPVVRLLLVSMHMKHFEIWKFVPTIWYHKQTLRSRLLLKGMIPRLLSLFRRWTHPSDTRFASARTRTRRNAIWSHILQSSCRNKRRRSIFLMWLMAFPETLCCCMRLGLFFHSPNNQRHLLRSPQFYVMADYSAQSWDRMHQNKSILHSISCMLHAPCNRGDDVAKCVLSSICSSYITNTNQNTITLLALLAVEEFIICFNVITFSVMCYMLYVICCRI